MQKFNWSVNCLARDASVAGKKTSRKYYKQSIYLVWFLNRWRRIINAEYYDNNDTGDMTCNNVMLEMAGLKRIRRFSKGYELLVCHLDLNEKIPFDKSLVVME
jgi:hypothetical protein